MEVLHGSSSCSADASPSALRAAVTMGRKVAIQGEAISGSSTCNLIDSFGYVPGIGAPQSLSLSLSRARCLSPRLSLLVFATVGPLLTANPVADLSRERREVHRSRACPAGEVEGCAGNQKLLSQQPTCRNLCFQRVDLMSLPTHSPICGAQLSAPAFPTAN